MKKIHTIDLQAKEWFDKVNGNSYFSAQITLNFGLKNQETIKIPFQYGYGSQFEHEALKKLQAMGHFTDIYSSLYRVKEYGVILRTSKVNALKRDVKAFGE